MMPETSPPSKKTLSGNRSAWITPRGRSSRPVALDVVELALDLGLEPGGQRVGPAAAGLEQRPPARDRERVGRRIAEIRAGEMKARERPRRARCNGSPATRARRAPSRKLTSAAGRPHERAQRQRRRGHAPASGRARPWPQDGPSGRGRTAGRRRDPLLVEGEDELAALGHQADSSSSRRPGRCPRARPAVPRS